MNRSGQNQFQPPFFQQFQQAAQVLDAGGVVAYPTETVWGLAALPQHLAALSRRKGRDTGKPLQVSCPDLATAGRLAAPHPLLPLLAQFWPGPLTVVTPASAQWPRQYPAQLAPGGLVGLRLPAHPVAQRLLEAFGPLATTSLNPAGQPAAITFEQAQAYALADLLLGDESDRAGGLASTVIQLGVPGDRRVQVIRAGALPAAELSRVLNPAGVFLK